MLDTPFPPVRCAATVARMARRVVETYFDENLRKWTNRLQGGSPVGHAFDDKIEAISRGDNLATFLGVRQVVVPRPRRALANCRGRSRR